jgi:glucose/mannose-6-phosphate isomerase
MRKIILDFPQQFEQGLKLAREIKIEGEFENVVVSGMGASAWPAEILATWLNLPIPLYINRIYTLPDQATKKSLAIFVSYSGNTEECLTAYQEAIKKGFSMAAITSGGQLKELCQKNDTPLVKIPTGLVPRMATGYIFTALYSILANSGLIENKSSEILDMAKNLKPAEQEKIGQDLAKKLKGKIPLIYTSDALKVLGYIWKIKFNENSKSPAFANYFSELNHNELEGLAHEKECDFHKQSIFHCLILKDTDDHPKIQKRMDLTAKILNETGLPTEIINLTGQTQLEKIFSSILLVDWASYYLAQEYDADPLATETIEEFKEKMEE